MIASRRVERHTSCASRCRLGLRIILLQPLDWRQGALHIPLDNEPQELAVAPILESLLEHAQSLTHDG
jgi:hypothetical protein